MKTEQTIREEQIMVLAEAQNHRQPSVLEKTSEKCEFAQLAGYIAKDAYIKWKQGDRKAGQLALNSVRELRCIARLESDIEINLNKNHGKYNI